jgi:nucleoid-associated protein YgaU
MRRISISSIVALACIIAAASSVAAQDLGEAARQERERKKNLTQHAPVITNQDLSRDRILFPRTETAPEVPPTVTSVATPANVTAPASVAKTPVRVQDIYPQPGQSGFSLGEYARKLREEKASRLAAEQRAAEAAVAATNAKEMPSHSAPVRSLQAARNFPARPLQNTKTLPAPLPTSKTRAPRQFAVTKDDAKDVARNIPDERTVEVRRGDSLWRISRRHLGHGHLWTLVWKSNPQIAHPDVIRIGQSVQLPSPEVVAETLAKEEAVRVASVTPVQPKPVAARQSNLMAGVTGRIPVPSSTVSFRVARRNSADRQTSHPAPASHLRQVEVIRAGETRTAPVAELSGSPLPKTRR